MLMQHVSTIPTKDITMTPKLKYLIGRVLLQGVYLDYTKIIRCTNKQRITNFNTTNTFMEEDLMPLHHRPKLVARLQLEGMRRMR